MAGMKKAASSSGSSSNRVINEGKFGAKSRRLFARSATRHDSLRTEALRHAMAAAAARVMERVCIGRTVCVVSSACQDG
jgi:hypothetical protein